MEQLEGLQIAPEQKVGGSNPLGRTIYLSLTGLPGPSKPPKDLLLSRISVQIASISSTYCPKNFVKSRVSD
jgi:hypothetical protein